MNKKGNSILWVLAVALIMTITLATSGTLAASAYNRSVNNANRNQAYLNAKSIANYFAKKFIGVSAPDSQLFEKLCSTYSLNIRNIEIDGKAVGDADISMGQYTGTMYISALSEIKGQEGSAKITLQSDVEIIDDSGGEGQSEMGKYFPSGTPSYDFEWPEFPEMTGIEIEKPWITPKTIEVGNDDGTDSYYSISQDMGPIRISPIGSGKIYIYVAPDVEVEITDIPLSPDATERRPNVYIILREDAELVFIHKGGQKEVWAYIYGEDGAVLSEKGNSHSFYGSIMVDYIDDNISKIEYIKPTDGSGGGGEEPSEPLIIYRNWRVVNYEKK